LPLIITQCPVISTEGRNLFFHTQYPVIHDARYNRSRQVQLKGEICFFRREESIPFLNFFPGIPKKKKKSTAKGGAIYPATLKGIPKNINYQLVTLSAKKG
jgi:hypothetical protein